MEYQKKSITAYIKLIEAFQKEDLNNIIHTILYDLPFNSNMHNIIYKKIEYDQTITNEIKFHPLFGNIIMPPPGIHPDNYPNKELIELVKEIEETPEKFVEENKYIQNIIKNAAEIKPNNYIPYKTNHKYSSYLIDYIFKDNNPTINPKFCIIFKFNIIQNYPTFIAFINNIIKKIENNSTNRNNRNKKLPKHIVIQTSRLITNEMKDQLKNLFNKYFIFYQTAAELSYISYISPIYIANSSISKILGYQYKDLQEYSQKYDKQITDNSIYIRLYRIPQYHRIN